MAQRFGRRRKRALEQRIKDLEIFAFGPAGRCPDHVESIDDIPYRSKTMRIEDKPDGYYIVEAQLDIQMRDGLMQKLAGLAHRPVQLDGRCFIISSIDAPHYEVGPDPFAMRATINMKQIDPPREARR